jgi:hypothetical protein
MNNIQSQKSGLAKLMATENLTVQHAKTPTAWFDPKRRVLTVPIWDKTSPELYDLLVGHEVGHALDTPADGWHGAVHDRGVNFKGFLNVVEDARIEKRQKRRYPGLRRSFVVGFNELMERDFFGIKDRSINNMSFIDRLNIFSKSGYTLPIAFNEKETEFVERVKELETWEDVLKLTNEIWDYSKEQLAELNLPQDYQFGDGDDGEDYEFSDGDDDAESEDGQESDSKKLKQKSSDEKSDEEGSLKSPGKEEEGEGGDEEYNAKELNRQKESATVRGDDLEPFCETDDNFRRNEASLIDKKARDYVYVKLPTPNLKNIVTPAKRVQEILTEEFSSQGVNYQTATNELYAAFRKKNERYISLLAKEFEMRKAASKFAKTKTAETGDIDISKIFKYQIDDNIFKKMMRVPKGKSHGLVLLLDKSGSMSDNLAGSYEQILILAMFCRKVNIPFTAYGFGNADGVREKDFPLTSHEDSFSKNVGEVSFNNVYLREMINSKMGNAEFTKAVKNILCLIDAWSGRSRYGYYGKSKFGFYMPQSEGLSNTPLSESLVATKKLIDEFRKQNNLDIVNLCVVHDGDADQCSRHITSEDKMGIFSNRYMNVILVDEKSKMQVPLTEDEDALRVAVSEWLVKTTGVKIIGFYLAPSTNTKSALRRRLYNPEMAEALKLKLNQSQYWAVGEVLNKYVKILRKEKFLESKNPGYESFFILPGDSLTVEDDEFETEAKTTAALTKAFGKYNKSRQVNRVLVSKFIGMIAV